LENGLEKVSVYRVALARSLVVDSECQQETLPLAAVADAINKAK
jgi:hypothetical protein